MLGFYTEILTKAVFVLFKKFKKMSKGKKAGTIIFIVVILLLIAYVVYNNFKPAPLDEYKVTEVYKGDIQTTYETSGTVMSNSTVNYTAANGVKVETVEVSVGDRVKTGDVLATFDVSGLNTTLAGYKQAYNKALNAYNQSASSIKTAQSNISSANSQIAALNKEIAALEKEINNAEANPPKIEIDTSSQYSPEQIAEIAQKLQDGGLTQEEITAITSSLQAQTGSITSEDIERAISNSVATKRIQLAQKESQKQLLETQKTLYNAQTDDTAMSIYKQVMEQKKADYTNYLDLYNKLKDGWTAESDGIITEVNIVPGEVFAPSEKKSTTTDISSILGYVSGNADMTNVLSEIMGSVSNNGGGSAVGMVLENTDEFIAEFSVGKYDLLNIKVGQKVVISSLDNEYEGEVIYVSATASETDSFDINSLAQAFSGSSSSSANGALVRVKILNPDEKVIIGFDVDIKIDTEKIEDVLVMPIDAVVTEDGINYVYTVDSENKVSKKEVEVGAYSDDDYELISGLEEGSRVVDNPKNTIKEGEEIAIRDK